MIYNIEEKGKGKKVSRTISYRTFKGKGFSKSYKQWMKNKPKSYKITQSKVLQSVISKIFENAAEALLEKDGGVVLDGIGYFAFYMPMYKRYKPFNFYRGHVIPPNYQTDYHSFFPYLFTDVFTKNPLKGWSMDRGFRREISRAEKRHRKLYYKEVRMIHDANYNRKQLSL